MKPDGGLCKKMILFGFSSLLLVGVLSFSLPRGDASLEDFIEEDDVFLLRGDLETIKTFGLTRISVSNPEIADLAKVTAEQVLILAKKQGQTGLFIWDKYGKRSVTIHVFDENLDLIKSRAEHLLAKVNIKGLSLETSELEGKVIVSGEISKDKQDKVKETLAPLGASILNLVQQKQVKDLVQIDAQIAELTTSATKTLGVDWTGSSALSFKENLPGTKVDKPWDAFKLGEFQRDVALTNRINALITEGKGRILSRPKLVVKSGEDASFLVGGQIPVVTRTLQEATILETIVYRNYGVDLTVTPTITEEGKVDIKLKIDVSDIDATTPVQNRVSFTSRTAETKLYLEDGQTVVLAGLIKRDRGENITRLPFLSDVPIFGAIFRSKTISPDKETELVITLTPTILAHAKKVSFEPSKPAGTNFSTPLGSGKETALDVPAHQPIFPTETQRASPFSEGMISYVQSVQQIVAQNVRYPQEARENGWEGTVKLALHILNDGTLVDASVKESSGYDLFDNDALMTAKRLAPYSAFPPESSLQELTVTIPLIYRLDTY